MENEINKNSGWPGFFQSNSPLAWFVVVVGALFVAYLLFSGATLEGCGMKISPKTEQRQDDMGGNKKEEQKNDSKSNEQSNSTRKAETDNGHNKEASLPKSSLQNEQKSYLFTGTVVDEQGQPVPNVKVICDAKEGLTDAAGGFRILLEQDPDNKDKLVSLFKEGYSSPPYEKRNNETYLFPRK
jgi:hypothetical protein